MSCARALVCACVVAGSFAPVPPAAAAASRACALPHGFYGAPPAEAPSDEAIPTAWERFIRPHGTVTARVVLVDFPDFPAEDTPQEVLDRIRPAEDLLETASYGRLSLDFIGGERWYRMPRDHGEYEHVEWNLYLDAAELADPDVDFSGTDIFVLVGPQGSMRTSAGSSVEPFIFTDERDLRHLQLIGNHSPFSVAHETGHNFGLPDAYLYDPFRKPGEGHPAGGWDLMGIGNRGPELFAWHRWKLEWLDDDQIACVRRAGPSEHVLHPVAAAGGGVKAIVVRTGGYRAYVIENRQALASDSGICEEGVLVYEVDTHRGSGEGSITVQTNESDEHRMIECGELWNAPLTPGPDDSFEDETEGVEVEVVAGSGDTYTVRVTRARSVARTAVTMRIGRRYVAHGAVSSPDMRECVGGARVRVVERVYEGHGRFRNVPVARTVAGGDGTYRVALPRPEEQTVYVAIVDTRTIRRTECLDSISSFVIRRRPTAPA